MLEKFNFNSVRSDEGWEIERIGKSEIIYKDKSVKCLIEVELGDGLLIYASTIPTEYLAIKALIIERIKIAFDYLEQKYIIQN